MRIFLRLFLCAAVPLATVAPAFPAALPAPVSLSPSPVFRQQTLSAALLGARASFDPAQTARSWDRLAKARAAAFVVGVGALGALVATHVIHISFQRMLLDGLPAVGLGVFAAVGYFGVHREHYQLISMFQDPYFVISVHRLTSGGPRSTPVEKEMVTFRFNARDVQAGKSPILLEELAATPPSKSKTWVPRTTPGLLDFIVNTIDVMALQKGFYYTRGVPARERAVVPLYEEDSVITNLVLVDALGFKILDNFARSFSVRSTEGVRWLSEDVDPAIDETTLRDFVMRAALAPLIFNPVTRKLALDLRGKPVTPLNVAAVQRLYFNMHSFHTSWLEVRDEDDYTYFSADGRTFRFPPVTPLEAKAAAKDFVMEERGQTGQWTRVEPRLRDYLLDAWTYAEDVIAKNNWPSDAPRRVPLTVGVDEEGIVVEEAGGLYAQFAPGQVRFKPMPPQSEIRKMMSERLAMAFFPLILNPHSQREALAAEERAVARYWEDIRTLGESTQVLRRLYVSRNRTKGKIGLELLATLSTAGTLIATSPFGLPVVSATLAITAVIYTLFINSAKSVSRPKPLAPFAKKLVMNA